MALISIDEAAKRLGVKPSTLRDWRVQRRNLPFVTVGALVRVDEADIESFIAACKVQPARFCRYGNGTDKRNGTNE